jgi:hypothetical protein
MIYLLLRQVTCMIAMKKAAPESGLKEYPNIPGKFTA